MNGCTSILHTIYSPDTFFVLKDFLFNQMDEPVVQYTSLVVSIRIITQSYAVIESDIKT